jgi:2-keto-4-pentenoate hydratase/2-oxohepta-3-ene-1,7-dioic acid hydratase in catechol pathway
MDRDRRRFLQTAGVAGAMSLASASSIAAVPAPAPGVAGAASAAETPKGMIFVSLRHGQRLGLGVKTPRGILDVERAAGLLHIHAPATIDELLRGRGDARALGRLVAKATEDNTHPGLFIDEAKADLGPCVGSPEKIVCIGLNYRKHAVETGQPIPATPILFNKYNCTLNFHRGEIAVSRQSAEQFDYEAELVIVMGREARRVGEAEALDYVFGYCTGNDFTARDLQFRTSQWMLGKTCDGYAPVGPYLVTADQVPDPNALKIECSVNGEVRQSSNTSDMIFSCRQLISYISQNITLKPGDIIFTGTPEGVIIGYPKEKRVWLKPGDKIVTRIERLGELHFALT